MLHTPILFLCRLGDWRAVMMFLVVVKVRLSVPYAQWKAAFDEDADRRRANGTHEVFCAPVVGEQSALYGVRTLTPRRVHDAIYDPAIRPVVERSGFIVGSEILTICEWIE